MIDNEKEMLGRAAFAAMVSSGAVDTRTVKSWEEYFRSIPVKDKSDLDAWAKEVEHELEIAFFDRDAEIARLENELESAHEEISELKIQKYGAGE